MLDELKKAIAKLEFSKEYRKYMKQNPKSFISSAFIMLDGEDNWQLDYYNPETKKITSFLIRERIKVKPESCVFKGKGDKVEKLELSKVRIGLDEAMRKVEKKKQERNIGEIVTKRIVVLQKLKDSNVWNITYLLSNLKAFNVKINCENGEIVSESFDSVISF